MKKAIIVLFLAGLCGCTTTAGIVQLSIPNSDKTYHGKYRGDQLWVVIDGNKYEGSYGLNTTYSHAAVGGEKVSVVAGGNQGLAVLR